MTLYVLDMIGVFAFAAYGAHRAQQAHMDVLGIFVCAALTALGGGTIRAVVLQQPPTYFTYIAFAAAGALFAVAAARCFHRLDPPLQILDALGLATFALSGASQAAAAGWGLGPMLLCAVLTGAGGGVLCDLMTGHRPQLFYGEFYAPPTLLMGLLAWLLRDRLDSATTCTTLVAAVFAIRMLALSLGWTVTRPRPLTPAPTWHHDTVQLAQLTGVADDDTIQFSRIAGDRT